MANLTVNNIDLSAVVLGNPEFKDDLLTFAGAGTVLDGTILARQSVNTAITVTPDGGNTGNGTAAASVVGVDEVPAVGSYNLECTFAITNGGVFKLEDPAGNIVEDNLTLRVGDTLVTTFNVQGLELVVTEGSTDFVAGDKFGVAVVANAKLVPFVIGGVAGAGIPKNVLTYDVTATGAGDEAIRSIISGEVRKEKLIIDADGDGSNITDTILDQLRDYGITPVNVGELNIQDNQ
ncbi:hypothetical protein KAR91_31945 [Candidatus Pacearchaeota archaeon]|nr:hypothetical protein [Candidatus Pacearchaeota archaeon]